MPIYYTLVYFHVSFHHIYFKVSYFFGCFVESAAQRPRLKLLPRSSGAPVNAPAKSERNAAIFGTGKPRDGPDPEIVVNQNRARKESGSST